MHLHDLLTKGNANLAVSEGVVPSRLTLNGELTLGVLLPKGRAHFLLMRNASEHPQFAAGLNDIGLVAALSPDVRADSSRMNVRILFRNASGETGLVASVGPEAARPLLIPDLLALPDPFSPADLMIETEKSSTDLFVGGSGRVNREPLYSLARGIGVEIGPGPRPQILNTKDTQVIYVEEKPAEEWLATYKTGASDAAWSSAGYRIGKAHDLPVDDGSLDFIFSSHVLEHLYNPLGHFDHWRRKLKPGGLILCVVPGADGTKDFVLPPTSIEELLEEHRAGGYTTPFSVYARWVRRQRPHDLDADVTARQLFDEGFSIHVHVYDYITVNVLLRRLVAYHGYDAFRIRYKRNAKDFIFALRAGRNGGT